MNGFKRETEDRRKKVMTCRSYFSNPAVGHLHCHALKMHFPFATRKMGAQIFKAALDFKRSEPFRGDLHLTSCPLEPSPFSEKMRASQRAK